MRCFIAIDIGAEIKKQLAALQQELKTKAGIKSGDAKWVKPDSMHLTLKFLGEIRDEEMAQVCDIVNKAAAKHVRFELEIARVGYFGKGSARVLWVGAGEDNGELFALQKDIEQNLVEAGRPKESRAFSGHLTLCRVKNPRAGRKLAILSEGYERLQLGSVPVDAVCVYQSRLTPNGPIYTVLSKSQLQ